MIKNKDGTLSQFPGEARGTGGLALTDATAGVVLAADQKCSYVDITAHNGLLAIGHDSSTRIDSTAKGLVLTPGSTPHRVFCTNLNQVYVSGASGTRATYVYY